MVEDDPKAVLYKIIEKSISFIFYYFSYFCQLLWTSNKKYKIILAKVIEIYNTIRSHYKSINIRLINKKKHISRLGFGTFGCGGSVVS